MVDLQITCINKSNRTDPHERITRVGGGESALTRWSKSQENAISDIERGVNSFYVSVGGARAQVVVALSRYGNKYLKTRNDGEQPNNLLSLRECHG